MKMPTYEEMQEDPEDKAIQELMDQIGEAAQFMAYLDDMYNESLEFYLNRVSELNNMADLDGMGEGEDSDDDGQQKGEKAKKDCKQQWYNHLIYKHQY